VAVQGCPCADPQARRPGGCDTEAMPDGADEYVVAGERRVEYCLYNRGAARRPVFQHGTPGQVGESRTSSTTRVRSWTSWDGIGSRSGAAQAERCMRCRSPEADGRALAARHEEEGCLERMSLTYRHGVDGWLEHRIAVTRPWGSELPQLTTPVRIWYGTGRCPCFPRPPRVPASGNPRRTTPGTPQRPCPRQPGPRGNLRLAGRSVSPAIADAACDQAFR